MSETLTLVLAWLAGGGLGAIFFGGLWWTVRKGVSSQRPALWFFGSLVLRTGIVLVGLYSVSGGHWERLVACMLGFVIARVIATLRLRPARPRLASPPAEHQIRPAQEASHAP